MDAKMMADGVRAGVAKYRVGISSAAAAAGLPEYKYQQIMRSERDITRDEFLNFCASVGMKPQTLIAMGIEWRGGEQGA